MSKTFFFLRVRKNEVNTYFSNLTDVKKFHIWVWEGGIRCLCTYLQFEQFVDQKKRKTAKNKGKHSFIATTLV
jgi:hypothetical protein